MCGVKSTPQYFYKNNRIEGFTWKFTQDFNLSGVIKDDCWKKEQIEEVIKGNLNLLLKL